MNTAPNLIRLRSAISYAVILLFAAGEAAADASPIRLVDANGRELIALANDKNVEGVPNWFIDYLPMSPAIAESEISSGWNISGVVYVTINPSFAYSKLYKQAKTSFYYSLA